MMPSLADKMTARNLPWYIGIPPQDEDRTEQCARCKLEVPYGMCDEQGRCIECAAVAS